MTNTDGERFDFYSASGKYLKQVGTFIEIYRLIQKAPETVFDLGEEEATIKGLHTDFEMKVGKGFQPQHARYEWNSYNNFPGIW